MDRIDMQQPADVTRGQECGATKLGDRGDERTRGKHNTIGCMRQGRAAQDDRATEATRQVTTSWCDERAAQNDRATTDNSTCNNQPTRREDEWVVQDDMMTEATRQATTSRHYEKTRGRRKMIGRQRDTQQPAGMTRGRGCGAT